MVLKCGKCMSTNIKQCPISIFPLKEQIWEENRGDLDIFPLILSKSLRASEHKMYKMDTVFHKSYAFQEESIVGKIK